MELADNNMCKLSVYTQLFSKQNQMGSNRSSPLLYSMVRLQTNCICKFQGENSRAALDHLNFQLRRCYLLWLPWTFHSCHSQIIYKPCKNFPIAPNSANKSKILIKVRKSNQIAKFSESKFTIGFSFIQVDWWCKKGFIIICFNSKIP